MNHWVIVPRRKPPLLNSPFTDLVTSSSALQSKPSSHSHCKPGSMHITSQSPSIPGAVGGHVFPPGAPVGWAPGETVRTESCAQSAHCHCDVTSKMTPASVLPRLLAEKPCCRPLQSVGPGSGRQGWTRWGTGSPNSCPEVLATQRTSFHLSHHTSVLSPWSLGPPRALSLHRPGNSVHSPNQRWRLLADR